MPLKADSHAQNQSRLLERVLHFVLIVLVVVPWVNPFAGGPSPAVQPWLVSLACAGGILVWRGSYGLSEMDSSNWPESFSLGLLIAALISSAIGLIQYAGASAWFAPWVSYSNLGEAFGNLRQRNQFATLTTIGMATLWWRQSKKGSDWPLAWSLLAAALLAVGDAASSSRTGMAQLAVLTVLALLWGGWRHVRQRNIVAATWVAYVAGLWLLPWAAGLNPFEHGLMARLRAGDSVCSSRLTLWRNVIHLIEQRPWQGWGWGELAYAHYITPYPSARFCDILDNAHNLPLHIAVELGIPVAAVACTATVWLVWRLRPWCESNVTRRLAWAVIAVISLHSMLEYPLWYGPFQMALLGAIAMLIPSRPERKNLTRSGSTDFASFFLAALGAVFIAVSVVAAWDYRRISQLYLSPDDRLPAYAINTLEKARKTWLFENQVDFAELTTMPLDQSNAPYVNALALRLLHYSPEPRVITAVIDSAKMLGKNEAVNFHTAQMRAAFPESSSESEDTKVPTP